MEVRPAGSGGAFEWLEPRQELKPSPYALYAAKTESVAWDHITGRPAGLDDGDDNTTCVAGQGLTLLGTTFSASFAGSGSAITAARSDHTHFGQDWIGNGPEGLLVENQSGAVSAFGLHGRTAITTPGSQAAAVRGESLGSGALGYGVWGSHSGEGVGVYGWAAGGAMGAKGILGAVGATTGTGVGVQGLSYSPDGTGVSGRHENTAGTAAGVLGETASSADLAAAIQGTVLPTSPGSYSAGVRGVNNGIGGLGIGVYGSQAGFGWGVYGETPSGPGVRGQSNTGDGVVGESHTGSGIGVVGSNDAGGKGVQGISRGDSGIGVAGSNDAHGKGVEATSNTGTAVWGYPSAEMVSLPPTKLRATTDG